MSRDDLSERSWLPDDYTGEDDDIEILEVVGLEDDEPVTPESTSAAEDDASSSDTVVALDEVAAGEAAEAAMPPAALPGDRQRLMRLQADFENLQRRVEREREDHRQQATSGLVGRLLAVVDNLERALAHPTGSENAEDLHRGVELVHRQLMDELRREGLRPVEALGQPFDPNHHEAVETQVSSEHSPNTVLEEFQRGYLLHDRLLRPALVRVSVAGPESGPQGGGEES